MSGGAPAGFLGPDLVGTVPAPEALMTIGIERRHEQHGDALQQAIGSWMHGDMRPGFDLDQAITAEQLAQRGEARILAVGFARMDAGLDHQQRNAALAQRLGRQRAAARYHQRAHRSPLGRTTVDEAAHRVGPARDECRAQRIHLIESAGVAEPGLLGQCVQGHCFLDRISGMAAHRIPVARGCGQALSQAQVRVTTAGPGRVAECARCAARTGTPARAAHPRAA